MSTDTAAPRPNIIIMFCDDLGYGDIGCFGSERNRTPRLDRMAAEGVRLTDFYVGAPLCTPSRAALMTGCYPRRVGLDYGYRDPTLFPGDPMGLNPDEISLASLLRDQGYATRMVGKWHLGDQPEFLPTAHGFDSYLGLPYSNDMIPDHPMQEKHQFPPLPVLRDDRVVDVDPNQASLTDNYLDEALRFIREQRDGPFFLYFAHMYVHVPIYAPFHFLCRSQNGPYGAAVEHIDHVTGALLDELAQLGIDDNTLVIFTSDNGSGGGGGSNAPLRGHKGSTWEGGIREPFIARWPRLLPAGHVSSELATAMDLLPSLVRWAGGTEPRDRIIDGRDIRPLLEGDGEARSPHDAFFYYRRNTLDAVRSGSWKLHLHTGQLVDLESDIGEEHDCSADHPEIVRQLEQRADACREDLGDESCDMAGANCRPVGWAEGSQPLTSLDWRHPYMQAAYD